MHPITVEDDSAVWSWAISRHLQGCSSWANLMIKHIISFQKPFVRFTPQLSPQSALHQLNITKKQTMCVCVRVLYKQEDRFSSVGYTAKNWTCCWVDEFLRKAEWLGNRKKAVLRLHVPTILKWLCSVKEACQWQWLREKIVCFSIAVAIVITSWSNVMFYVINGDLNVEQQYYKPAKHYLEID